ncbi:FGGY-family carbohydrate kinase [Poseidonocella sp. HB161398]|uniref:FGGY-family carbohydrate kinase n=1 Tax=Poseidonocella sp. HB161398 TaxID=2320855 RepID=UPI001108161C|nr:FGGY-family carbohydrate kinase [Poseidonocella sp. HB161398]
MSALALGIDIGTSGVRAALLAPGGAVAGFASARMPGGDEALRTPGVWRDTLAAALALLFADQDPARVGAVAVDGTSGTVLALDARDRPVGTALMYHDAVGDPAIPAAIAAVAPRESAAHGAASALARAIVLQDRPGVARLLHQADWIAGLLADAPVASDESNALKTGYDPVLRRWPDWLARTSLRPGLLPEVRPVGAVTGRSSGAFGLPRGVPVVAGMTDGCAAFLATGADRPGDGVTSLGTTLTVKLLSDRPVFAPEHGIYSHRIGETWLAGGASNTGGGVLAAHFSRAELERLSAQIDPASPSGLDYYPLPRPGERFPVSDPALPPRLEPRPAADALFLQGMLEAMARIEAEGYARLAALGAPRLARLRTVGGGAGNPVWRALREAALGVADAPPLSEDAAVGTARIALAALPAAVR